MNQNLPKRKTDISVIIPTFNRKDFLYPTLICLLNQKTKITYEIIVVDSGNDGTGEIVKKIKNQTNVKVLYKKIKKTQNRSLLRNTGVKYSNSDILIFLDNDILVSNDFIENHYVERQNLSEKTIVLGKRKYLTDINITVFGIKNLLSDFELLDKLPYIIDVRENYKIKNDLWRFLFSHNFSIMKNIFLDVSGFNQKFGNYWGYEDIELGFRLYLNGASFIFSDKVYGYHQPHFEKRILDYDCSKENRILFIKNNPYFEVELFCCFPDEYDRYYNILKKIKQNLSDKQKDQDESYDFIFACLNSYLEKDSSKKEGLGLLAFDFYRKKFNKVLIRECVFNFPDLLKFSIFNTAIENSKEVYIKISNTEEEKDVYSSYDKIGFAVDIKKTTETLLQITKKNVLMPLVCLFYLSDVFQNEKRVVSIFFARQLKKAGWIISLTDFRNNYSDLPKDLVEFSYCSLAQLMKRCFGFLDMHNTGFIEYKNTNVMITVDDIEYPYCDYDDNYKNLDYCKILQKQNFEIMQFMTVFDVFKNYHRLTMKQYLFCTFMNNGFYEDGIDIVIKAFSSFLKNNESKKLLISVCDYKDPIEKCYPNHNSISRNSKLYNTVQKMQNDLFNLQKMISEYKLEKNVIVEIKKFSITEMIKNVDSSEILICVSRTFCTQLPVYAGLLCDCKIVTTKYAVLDENLRNKCNIVNSEIEQFSEIFTTPCDEDIVKRVCINCKTSVLTEKISSELKTAYLSEEEINTQKKRFDYMIRDL